PSPASRRPGRPPAPGRRRARRRDRPGRHHHAAAAVGNVPDGTVWLPECSPGSTVRQSLGVGHGAHVSLSLTTADSPEVAQ
ncbi:hypothetical protein, partial [Actinomyces ruminis]|uniref:hypothetical protein n=1 Tax=Actinomyces ruminis TaxID=1937003 RepID=UPI001C55895A